MVGFMWDHHGESDKAQKGNKVKSVSSYTYSVVHGVATCHDCGWTTESYKNAQAISKQHATRYGHHVSGELGIAFSYTGSPVEEKAKKA